MMSLQRSVVDGRRSLALNNVVGDEFHRCAAWMTLSEFSNSTRLLTGRRHQQTSGPHVPLSLCAPRSRRQRSRLLYKSHTSYIVVSFSRIYTSASAALQHLVGFHGTNNHIRVLIAKLNIKSEFAFHNIVYEIALYKSTFA